ncbi:MAG TPA: site-2 protease family protein [Epsilonproteobacteria bacterium]|nr:site-2 protease family protein [Campylobacterota bacterium]
MSEFDITRIIATFLALLVAIIGHEIMHGWVAFKHGDNTAKNQGRLSINPISHIDPIGSLLLPAVLFLTGAPFVLGWAKPVPVNMTIVTQNKGTRGALEVILAGVSYNFALAFAFALLLGFFGKPENLITFFLIQFFIQSIIINVILGVFNLWPIPPLDGSQALRYIALHQRWHQVVATLDKIYPYGMFIILGVLLFAPLRDIMFSPVWMILSKLLPS